jgi:hypothetical protein
MQRKMKRDTRSASRILYSFTLLFVFFFTLLPIVCSRTQAFTPTPPVGPTRGYINIDYEFSIVTMNQNASWLFNWGDGSNSSWLNITEGESSIVQTHRWVTAGMYQVILQYKNEFFIQPVSSPPLVVNISNYSLIDIPSRPIIYMGKIQGAIGNQYTYYVRSTDPQDSQLCYRFDAGDAGYTKWTSLIPTGSSCSFSHTWSEAGEYLIRVQARNQYGLESEWSDLIHVIMKNTSNDDERSIDILVLNNCSHHIIFTSSRNGTFYNSTTGLINSLQWMGGGEYFIDDDIDGSWDYLYAPSIGEIQSIQQHLVLDTNIFVEIPWLLLFIIVGSIISVLSVVIILVKIGFIYVYEEVVVEN